MIRIHRPDRAPAILENRGQQETAKLCAQANIVVKEQRKAGRERLELLLLQQIRVMKLPEPERNHRFHPSRKWELDFAWLDLKLGIEVQGGTYTGGKHVRGAGYSQDLQKIGEAMVLGWSVYCCDTKLVHNGQAIDILNKLYFNHAQP